MNLVFDRRGSGEPLVLLHGIGARRQAFAPVLDLLADEFEVWSPDLPGFGESPAPPGGIASIPALAGLVAQWLGEQGLERPHVAGSSMGGGLALELADRGAVASACALAPIGFWSTAERLWCQRSLAFARSLSKVIRPVAPTLLGHPVGRTLFAGQYYARPWAIDPQALVGDVAALVDAPGFEDARAAFAGYLAPATAADRVPVTVAWGDRDRLNLTRQRERARSRIPRARHVLLPGTGHLMMSDDPEAVADVIRAAGRAPHPSPA